MKTSEQLKQIVKDKYGEIAEQSRIKNETSCCGSTCGCDSNDEVLMAEDYSKLHGYVADANLGLGCGLPTEFAQIKKGDVVVDLGSGAGNDAFVARSVTGAEGKVIGIDFTERMITKARANAEKMGFNNVEFRFGDIENMPLSENVADVVVSNCVLNLVPDKQKAFTETFRILKRGGHFSVSDIVLKGNLPAGLKESADMYAGCISGAIQYDDYLQVVKEAGFKNIKVQKEKKITIPDEILSVYLTDSEKVQYATSTIGIYSITLFAEKPSVKDQEEACCAPGCCGN
jgi:ubiquinone/menaquinone biosynthesis C-methylase UbiE